MRVAVLGASPDPEKYSNKAVRFLLERTHEVVPVNPRYTVIENLNCLAKLSDIRGEVHTLSLYVGSDRLAAFQEEILALKPKRVIFNPGTENAAIRSRLEAAGIDCLEACTLVLLRTNQF